MQPPIGTRYVPESWKKTGLLHIPMSSAFSGYYEAMTTMDPKFADECLVRYLKSFKKTYDSLECYPKGPERAARAANEIGKLINRGLRNRKITGEPLPTCQANCPACCHIRVTLTDSEADYLVGYLKEKRITLDRELTELQWQTARTDDDHMTLPYEKRACPILGEDGNCRAYDARPLVCRKFMVASPPWMCDTRLSPKSAFIMDPEVEGFVAAQMCLEQPEADEDDNISNQLLRRIPANDGLWNNPQPLEK